MNTWSTLSRKGIVDLFCGAGGFSWGWQRAGFDLLACVDNDTTALRSHELNFGGEAGAIVNRDLSKLSPSSFHEQFIPSRRDILAIVGGPPCQGWSRVGRGKIKSLKGKSVDLLRDPRNTLYRRFLRYVDHLRPPLFVMENVPGMASVQGKNIAQKIIDHFTRIGFKASYVAANALWFGVPQDRKRLIFMGVRKDLRLHLEAADLEKFAIKFRKRFVGMRTTTSVGQAIRDLPHISNGEREDPQAYKSRSRHHNGFLELMREGSNGVITDHVCWEQNDQDVRAFKTMRQGQTYVDLDEEFKRYRDDIFTDKYKKLSWSRSAGTVTAHLAKDCYTHIHPAQARTISVREAARLQSFPDSFRFFGNMNARFKQIGNAVPPLMAWGIAEFVKSWVKASR
jgi:DNA (cytosine-5)-methyltransferase 1